MTNYSVVILGMRLPMVRVELSQDRAFELEELYFADGLDVAGNLVATLKEKTPHSHLEVSRDTELFEL